MINITKNICFICEQSTAGTGGFGGSKSIGSPNSKSSTISLTVAEVIFTAHRKCWNSATDSSYRRRFKTNDKWIQFAGSERSVAATVEVDGNGDKRWRLNGERHRTDGPAVEWADGSKFWYLNGERHRTDGSAIEWASGGKEWYLNGKKLSEKQFNEQAKQLIRKNHK